MNPRSNSATNSPSSPDPAGSAEIEFAEFDDVEIDSEPIDVTDRVLPTEPEPVPDTDGHSRAAGNPPDDNRHSREGGNPSQAKTPDVIADDTARHSREGGNPLPSSGRARLLPSRATDESRPWIAARQEPRPPQEPDIEFPGSRDSQTKPINQVTPGIIADDTARHSRAGGNPAQAKTPDVIADDTGFSFHSLPPFPHPFHHPLKAAYWIFELTFGVISLFALLAFLAAIPVANFLALGYMLEAEGRVARTGKLRYAMPLLPLAPKLGGIAFGTWLWCRLVRTVADVASDAELIAPGSFVAIAWQIGLTILTIGVALHVTLAIARGGRLGLFFWPMPLNAMWLVKQVMRGDYPNLAATAVKEFIAALRLRQHFWLGVRGFFGAFALLLVPTILFSALQDTSKPGQVLLTLFGGLVLVCVLSWVPFLQARFAAEHRFSAMFELSAIRKMYRRAPIAFLLSAAVMYALALPLYLFKLFETPQDMRWMLTPIFVVSIYPARILVGWAYSWAQRKERRSWLIVRLICGLIMWPALSFYVFMLFFTPAVGAAGRAVLYQHHAILLPWPF